MENAIFNIAEVAAWLEANRKPVAAQCLREFWGPTQTNYELEIWFQRHFGREQAYKLFRQMETQVSQSINHLV
jgi:hypothetical protein